MNFREELPAIKTPEERIHPDVESAYLPAKTLLERSAINPKDFLETYGEEAVRKDIVRAEKKEANFTPDAQGIYAKVLEGILFDQIQNNDWFGKGARAIKTSNYDDYFNGSDLVLELEEVTHTLSHLSLSIDITFGTRTEERKFARIKQAIDEGTLGDIKYFRTEQASTENGLSMVPQVVIGIEKDLLIKLSWLWANKEAQAQDVNNSLAAHPVQRLILSEILTQLLTFKRYAHDTKKESLVPIYEKSIKILEGIIQEKGPVDMSSLRDDKVFVSIRESLKIFSAGK